MNVNPRAMKLALEAWVAYDAGLAIIAHQTGEVGWRGQTVPELDRLYERALVLTRTVMGLHMGALGEGELSPAEVAAIIAEVRSQ